MQETSVLFYGWEKWGSQGIRNFFIFHINTASKWPKPDTNLIMAGSKMYWLCLRRGAHHLGSGRWQWGHQRKWTEIIEPGKWGAQCLDILLLESRLRGVHACVCWKWDVGDGRTRHRDQTFLERVSVSETNLGMFTTADQYEVNMKEAGP